VCQTQEQNGRARSTASRTPVSSVCQKSQACARLKNRMAELDQQLVEHQSQVQSYRKQLADRDREISKLRRNTHIP